MKKLLLLLSVVLLSFSLFAQSKQFYWDNPEVITEKNAYFPQIVSSGDNRDSSIMFFEEVDETSKSIWINSQKKVYGSYQWLPPERIAGPYTYYGNVPDIYSVIMHRDGTAVLSVMSDNSVISVFTKKSEDSSWAETRLQYKNSEIVGPRVYTCADGSYILFVTANIRQVQKNSDNEEYEKFSSRIMTSVSKDGLSWSSFDNISSFKNLSNPALPCLYASEGADILVLQSQYTSPDGETVTRQLYSSVKKSNERDWSEPVLITDDSTLLKGDSESFYFYQNQRPVIYGDNNNLYITWERSPLAVNTSDIFFAELTPQGLIKQKSSRRLNTSQGINAHRSRLFTCNGSLSAVWFDDRSGSDDIYMAVKTGAVWNETRLTSSNLDCQFAFPVLENNGEDLAFIYQQQKSQKGNPVIYTLQKDHTVDKPVIKPLSFKAGKKSTASRVQASVILPQDNNGIAGYSYIWTQDKDAEPPEYLMNLSDVLKISGNADEDGEWYFKVKACDNVMNWSESASVYYVRDTTPPHPPLVKDIKKDSHGFSISNDVKMSWMQDDSDDDVSGFTWNLVSVAPLDKSLNDTKRHPLKLKSSQVQKKISALLSSNKRSLSSPVQPPRRNMGKTTAASYENMMNGLYTFSVCAVDTVGNISKSTTVTLLLNKYKPETLLAAVNSDVDDFGTMDLTLMGKGFTYDGTVTEIYLDKDGQKPYDLVLRGSDKSFKVVSDELINGITVSDLEEGAYRIGILHPDRGLYFSTPVLNVTEYGNVKIFDRYEYTGNWTCEVNSRKYQLDAAGIAVAVLFIFFLSGTALSGAALGKTAIEAVSVKNDVKLLLEGKSNMAGKNKNIQAAALKRKGLGLRIKLVFYTDMLVLMIICLVALPLGFIMIQEQESTLSEGLYQRVNVLMQSVSTSTKIYLPAENDTEISSLPNQTNAFDDILYATITSLPRSGQNTNFDYVWASNDKEIKTKIDSEEFIQGKSRLTGDRIDEITATFSPLVTEVNEKIENISIRINMLVAEAMSQKSSNMDAIRQIDDNRKKLQSKIDSELDRMSSTNTVSYPSFNAHKLDRSNTLYNFYKPVFYKQQSTKNYVCAVVMMKVSTQNLIESVDAERHRLIVAVCIIAVIALTLGSAGSLIVATVIVHPLKRLVAHVYKINETKNKEKLAGHEIAVRSHDEIGLLCETVNDMTRGLVKAAMDEKLLMDGKVVQQTFLPLTAIKGGKATTAVISDEALKFYGYYEGASGVSGDYFDYKKLEDPWYVVIKCDASGHGVPAALIMTVVATLFRKYFEDWSFKKKGTNLNVLVRQINDFIESLGLKGKFATLLIALVNSKTGDVYLCNAGDNIVHYYDTATCRLETLTLMRTPAAGPLPSDLVDMKGGFGVEKFKLKKNDVLFLYTDGIEESTRKVRDKDFVQIEQEVELLEADRITEIIEAVFGKKTFILEKKDNPVNETLLFDFSQCEGTIEEAITALISIEKVFRFVKDNECTENDLVRVDRKIDAFLKKYFNRYDYYCSNLVDDGSENYVDYKYIKEDEQLDDLTLVAIRRV